MCVLCVYVVLCYVCVCVCMCGVLCVLCVCMCESICACCLHVCVQYETNAFATSSCHVVMYALAIGMDIQITHFCHLTKGTCTIPSCMLTP